MRILAIETTDIAGSVALFEADQLIAGSDLDPQLRSAQSLAPGIAALLQNAGWQPKQVQLVAVAVGPGSFTGLRVGISTAKLFAYAISAEVMGVNTLEVIAAQAPAEISALWAVLDAQRAQVFAGRFQRELAGSWRWDRHVALIDNTAWLASLSPGEAVSGLVLEKLKEQIPSGVTLIDRGCWAPKAFTVGRLAWQEYQAGRREDLFALMPQYYRPSAAEEKRSAERT